MNKKILFGLPLLVASAFLLFTHASSLFATGVSDTYSGSYWNLDSNCTESPTIPNTSPDGTSTDAVIDFNWDGGHPSQVSQDTCFAARWTRTVRTDSGRYIFRIDNLNDGARVYVDNVLIINQWSDHGGSSYSMIKDLTAGEHTLKIEYYQRTTGDAITFSYSKALADGGTWLTNNAVYTSTIGSDGNLYIGGAFTYVGPNSGGGVLTDSGNGHILSTSTFPMLTGGAVLASTPDGSGGFYVGGSFQYVGTQYHPYLAHIDSHGDLDASWNPRVNNSVYTLVYASSTIYNAT